MLIHIAILLLMPIVIQADSTNNSRSYNELMACFELMPGNVSRMGYTPAECVSPSDPRVVLSVLVNMMDREAMQILTFSFVGNFNLLKTRFMIGSVDENDTVVEYIGFETTTRFEKKGKMIVLSRSLVKLLGEKEEMTDQNHRIKLIASRKQKGYIFHIYDVASVNMTHPDIDLIHDRTIVRISMDAQESVTNKKHHHVALSLVRLLFGEEAAGDRFVEDEEVIVQERHSGLSLAPFLIGAVVVFAAVLICSCHIGVNMERPNGKIIHKDE